MIKIRILVFLFTLLVVICAGLILILYARGYRLGIAEKKVSLVPKGILVINSDPTGAQVFINGEIETATNNTLSLTPASYDIQIRKDGFLSWEKRIRIEKETVTQIDAFLIASAPSLTALTFSGVFNPKPTLDFAKIAYGVPPNSKNVERAGLWILETVNLPLGFNRDPRQITDGDLTNAKWEWSPDGREILLSTNKGVFLLDATKYTPQNQRVNVASQITIIKDEWEEKADKKLSSQLSRLDDEIEKIFRQNALEIKFSPDENRILYTAGGSATIPSDRVKPLPGASTQEQERDIKDGKTYVYDIKEDRNFVVGEKGETLHWLPNSLNLLMPKKESIIIMDYDGTNKKSIFGDGYEFPNAYSSTSSNRIMILTKFGGENALPNLYWLSLK